MKVWKILARIVVLMPGKINLKAQVIKKNGKGKNRASRQETINVYAPSNITQHYIR